MISSFSIRKSCMVGARRHFRERSLVAGIYILGSKKKVVSKFISLKTTGGCEFVPGVASDDIETGINQLANEKLTPLSFLIINDADNDDVPRREWPMRLHGTWIKKYPGIPCVVINGRSRPFCVSWEPNNRIFNKVKMRMV